MGGPDYFGETIVPSGLTGVVGIAVGERHTVALRGDGSIVAWGDNSFDMSRTPSNVANVVAIAAGGSNTHGFMRVTPVAPPTIATLNATAGREGDLITVAGGNFVNVVAVRVAGRIARWIVDSPVQLRVVLPSIVARGPIEVVTVTGATLSTGLVEIARAD